MLDNLINLVRENAGQAITNNPAIPNEHNDAAVQEASSSIMDTLRSSISGGNIQDVISMFSGGSAGNNNPVVQDATSNLTDRLKEKFNLDPSQAADISKQVVPNVMNQLAQKTADPADNGFNVQDIFNQLSGGKTSGMDVGGLVNKFKPKLDGDRDGDVDLEDLKSMFTGGNVVDKLKGLFS